MNTFACGVFFAFVIIASLMAVLKLEFKQRGE